MKARLLWSLSSIASSKYEALRSKVLILLDFGEYTIIYGDFVENLLLTFLSIFLFGVLKKSFYKVEVNNVNFDEENITQSRTDACFNLLLLRLNLDVVEVGELHTSFVNSPPIIRLEVGTNQSEEGTKNHFNVSLYFRWSLLMYSSF